MDIYKGFSNTRLHFLLLIYTVSLLTFTDASAQDSTATDYSPNTIVLPALSSSPETSLLFGGVGIFQFKMGNQQLNTRASSVVASGIYTLKNQSSFGLQPSLILENERWLLNGMYAYSYFPESFWGVGSDLNDNDKMRLIYRQLHLSQSALRQVLPKFFVGPQVRWSKHYNIRFENPDGDTIKRPSYPGSEDYYSTGIGFTIRWDTRDRIMAPTKNHFLEFSVLANPSWLSTLDSYNSYLLDGRKYVDLLNDESSVLAFQFFSKVSSGKPPINDIAILGGQNLLRGYYQGRLRDKHGAQIQGELRQQVYGRIGVAVFASAGQVWSSFHKMGLKNTHFSAGGGLRFNLNKEDPTNIRVDYGIGQNTSGLYITIGEAF